VTEPSRQDVPERAAEGVEAFGYRQELKRSLSFVDLLVYGLIFMVPIAPFGIFGSVFQASGGMVVLAYLIGALGMAFTAASYAQMSRAFPVAGSVYTYAGRGIAQPVGSATSISLLMLVAALSLLLGIYMSTRADGITLLSTLVNFGALSAFLVLHVSLVVHHVVRRGSRDRLRHLVLPVIGFLILAFAVVNAQVGAQTLGFVCS
jgi:amino acid transporter